MLTMENQAHLREYTNGCESDDHPSLRDLPMTSRNNNDDDGLHSDTTRHPLNGLFIRRKPSSFRTPRNYIAPASPPVDCSSLVRFGGDSRPSASPSTPGRHKAVIGVVKLQSKMGMSDMRKRLSRRRAAAVPMFLARSSGDCGEIVPGLSGRHDHGWGVFRPLRSSVHLVGMLTKFGCITTN